MENICPYENPFLIRFRGQTNKISKIFFTGTKLKNLSPLVSRFIPYTYYVKFSKLKCCLNREPVPLHKNTGNQVSYKCLQVF